MTRRALVYNPVSGGWRTRRTIDAVRRVLDEAGEPVELLPTRRAGHAVELAEALGGDAGPLEVLVLGGDGTLNEVVFGAFRAGLLEGSEPRVRFGVLPFGTTNVIARDLGLPLEPVAAARALALGVTRSYDLGLCSGPRGSRPFLLACGIGFEADVIARVPRLLKRVVGHHAYTLTGLASLGRRERRLLVDFERADGGIEIGVPAASVIVGNSRFYAGTLRLSTDAATDDGVLELALLASTRLLPLLRAGLRAMSSEMRGCSGVRVVPVRRATVRCEAVAPVHVDAELAGTTPVEITVRPRGLRLLH